MAGAQRECPVHQKSHQLLLAEIAMACWDRAPPCFPLTDAWNKLLKTSFWLYILFFHHLHEFKRERTCKLSKLDLCAMNLLFYPALIYKEDMGGISQNWCWQADPGTYSPVWLWSDMSSLWPVQGHHTMDPADSWCLEGVTLLHMCILSTGTQPLEALFVLCEDTCEDHVRIWPTWGVSLSTTCWSWCECDRNHSSWVKLTLDQHTLKNIY